MDKAICIGKNYLEHAVEMGDGIPDKPVVFIKTPSCILQAPQNGTIKAKFLEGFGSLHHECEIVLRVGPDAKTFDAVTLGLDMTLRDLQSECKKKSQPWEISKGFRNSGLIGPWILIKDFPNYLETEFTFKLNGTIKQKGFGKKMRTPPLDCLKYAQQFFDVQAGDILFTGTPEGVGPVIRGDNAELNFGKISFKTTWV